MSTTGIVVFAGDVTLEKAIWDTVWGQYVFLKLSQKSDDKYAANPFKKFTKMRKGRVGTRFGAVFTLSDGSIFYDDEVMLKNWSDGATGWTLHLWVNSDNAGFHPFLGVDAKALFALAMVEMDDDNTAIDQVKRDTLARAPKSRAEMKLSNYAATLCRTPEFWFYLESERQVAWMEPNGDHSKGAAEWMRSYLCIKSRAVLDEGGPDAQTFHDKIRIPYRNWYRKKNP